MATRWRFEQHLDTIEQAASDLAGRARRAGPAAAVPSCPRWTVADLVAHQGMVHRWAVSNLCGWGPVSTPKSQILAEVPAERLVDWFEDGARLLLKTLHETAPDVDAMVFLRDAPAAREFWARRQAHETTIHAVDALAAELGRLPLAEEAGIRTGLAMDGLDELLCGFVPRGRSRLERQDGSTVAVLPDDAEEGWLLRLGDRIEAVPVRADSAEIPAADHRFTGTAAPLYLGLWNRGDEITSSDSELLRQWRGKQRIRWS
ncbi:MAG TPA: maleylpyruvate isomerase N-terminal domain-containing protein [Actinomycetales bacterium]|nr:maleylpyruvate isomerase N-terminal domain-containing protein [Actinomycetales bacterium]